MSYNKDSNDSLFSQILTRLSEQDKNAELMLDAVKTTNGRVRKVEKFCWALLGGLIAISTLGGWYAAMPHH